MTEKRPRTSTMNKTELMLLEKQLAFRMVKDSQRPSTGSFSVRSPTKNSFSKGSRDHNNNNSFSLPNINSPSPSSSSSPHKLSTMIDQELISTLSTKPVSLRRKVMSKLTKKKKNSAFDSQPDLLSLKPDASYMKKGEKIDPNRRDGMTLSELYHFKKNDTWGLVFEGQAKADAIREIVERQQKETKNGTYGQQLKRQLDDLHAREAEYARTDVHFTQDYFGHRMYEKDEARKQANIAKIEGFRPLITADIAFKNKIREDEVLNDIQANEATLRRIHRELAMDEQKKIDKKLREKEQLARMTRENDALLILKAKQKLVIEAEDRRINAQAIERAEREDKRRKDDFAAMMAKCAGGDLPGHRIVAALQRAKAEKEEEFYQTLVTADNLINKQTQASEDIAKARKAKDGQGLSDDWEHMRKLREKRQMDDAERARQLVIYNAAKVKEEEKKVALAKEKKRLTQMKYQKELEEQLGHVKYRTLEGLAQTMSTVELGLNAELLKTTGVSKTN